MKSVTQQMKQDSKSGQRVVGLYPTDAGSPLLLLAAYFNLKYSTSITRQLGPGGSYRHTRVYTPS